MNSFYKDGFFDQGFEWCKTQLKTDFESYDRNTQDDIKRAFLCGWSKGRIHMTDLATAIIKVGKADENQK